MNESRQNYKGLIAALIFGGILRMLFLGSQSLWVDEVGTWVNVLDHNSSITRFSFYGNNAPPLYFWVLNPILKVFGGGEVALRSLSVVSGTLTLFVFWKIANRLFLKDRVADISVWLLALNPLHLWYSQEARPYAFFVLIFCTCCLQFFRALEDVNRTRRWVFLAVLMVLCAWTHTLSVMLIPLFVGWVVFMNPSKKGLVRLGLCCAVFSAVAVPVVLFIRRIAEVSPPDRSSGGLDVVYTFFTFLSGYSFGPSIRSLQLMAMRDALISNWPQIAVVGLVLGWLGIVAIKNISKRYAVLYVWIATPILVATLISLVTAHSYNVRFVLPSLLGFLLLVAVLITRLSGAERIGLCSVLAGIFLLSDFQWFFVTDYGKDDSRAAVESVLRVRPNVRSVAVAPTYMADTIRYYLRQNGSDAKVLTELTSRIDSNVLLVTRRQHIPLVDMLEASFILPTTLSFKETGYTLYLQNFE